MLTTTNNFSRAATVRRLKKAIENIEHSKGEIILANQVVEKDKTYIIFGCSDGVTRTIDALDLHNNPAVPYYDIRQEVVITVYPNVTGEYFHDFYLNSLSDMDYIQFLNNPEIKKRWEEWE